MFRKSIVWASLGGIINSFLVLPLPALAAEEEADQRVQMEQVQRFSNALNQIKKYYVNKVSDQQLFDNAIRGMLSGLDPHSGYLDEQEYRDLENTTNGEFGGVGLEVTMEDGVIKVVTPLVDTPAFKAGVKAGDYIIKLGDKTVQGMDLKDAVNMMRGAPGSNLEMTIFRKGEKKPLSFTLVREKILIQSVKSRLLENNYGYIRLSQFQATTAKDMEAAIAALKQKAGSPLKGLVLDLRNNPGGLLDTAIQVSDAFLEDKNKGKQEKIVYTQGRLAGSQFVAMAKPGDLLASAPIVVLINGGSASASEIVAGALQDNKRAIIVGTRSFGKGSVQTVLPLDNKSAIKLTTALYYTPSGRSIQAKGIEPDITVEDLSLSNVGKREDLLGMSEGNLKGHIKNANETKDLKADADSRDEKALLKEDYQLYAALTILKGLSLAQR